MRFRGFPSLVIVAALVAGILLPIVAAPAATAASPGIDELFMCEVIGGENFCTDMGFIPPEVERAVRKQFAAAAAGGRDDLPGDGDAGPASILGSLLAMNADELKAHQDAQLEDARSSAGTGLKAAAIAARSGRLGLGATTTAAGDSIVKRMQGFSAASYKQREDHWCGPATMALIARANGLTDTQANWATALGTTKYGTAMSSIVSTINEHRSWWHPQGAYSAVNVSGRSEADFKAMIQLRIGWDRPVVLHPTLRTDYFSHIKFHHGGHFQPGYGYNASSVLFVEVYNERDFYPTTGASSAGYRSTSWAKARQATLHTSDVGLRTLGL